MNKIILSLVLIILTTGCSVKPQRVVVTDTKLVYTPLPADYLKNCKTTQPPKKDDFLALKDPSEKESVLTKYIISLHKDIKTCDGQIDAIRKFDAEQIELIKKKNKKK